MRRDPLLLVLLGGLVKVLDGLGVLGGVIGSLIKQQLAVVVEHLGLVLELLLELLKLGLSALLAAVLVESDGVLDLREDEGAVELGGLLVLLDGLLIMAGDEHDLAAVVIDVGVIGVEFGGCGKVVFSAAGVACSVQSSVSIDQTQVCV